jgi:heterodisulfide reductase subunit A-like polyferredoxin
MKSEKATNWYEAQGKSFQKEATELRRPTGVAEQQEDKLKEIILNLTQYGVEYAVGQKRSKPVPKYQRSQHPKQILVIGAGISGLTAAYELAQVKMKQIKIGNF